MNNPSSDCLKAKGELRSLLKRKQWKLLRAANAEGATNGKSTSSYLLGPVHIVRTQHEGEGLLKCVHMREGGKVL